MCAHTCSLAPSEPVERVLLSIPEAPLSSAARVVTHYGDALARKILVDISNPFNADATGLATTPDSSAAQEIATAAPKGTPVVKALTSTHRRTSPRAGRAGTCRRAARPVDGGHYENGP